jgi:hypothetical protein
MAKVQLRQWEAFTRAFTHVMKYRPDGIVQSILTQDSHDLELWRIMTVWESAEALDVHYRSDTCMPGAYVFHLISVVPIATVSDVAAYV